MNPYTDKCPQCGERVLAEGYWEDRIIDYFCGKCRLHWSGIQDFMSDEQFETLKRIDKQLKEVANA